MFSSAGHKTRRISQRVCPGGEPAHHPKKGNPHATTSRSNSSNIGDIFGFTSVRVQELQKKLCPVTGILRDISADYHIFSTVLGEGHYGCVRECADRRTRRILAVKTIDKSKVPRIDHLRREVCLLHKTNHHGIMKMIDCYEDASCVHIVSERYTGGELFNKISENKTANGCLSEQTAAGIVKSLLEAVAYLHANEIVHRDIKPENVLFESTQQGAAVKLIDFGLSRMHRRGDRPMDNPVGTAYYMAPELLEGEYDKACDIWSVGTVAYIMLCGYPPFNGRSDSDIFDAIMGGRLAFPKLAWSSKSDEAKDFMKCLMRMDPHSRLTAKEALEHPWIRKFCPVAHAKHTKQEDIKAMVKMLRLKVQRPKKSVQQR